MNHICLTFSKGADRRRLRVPEPGLLVEERLVRDDVWDWHLKTHIAAMPRLWAFIGRRASQLRQRGWDVEIPGGGAIVVRCMCCHRVKGSDGVFGPEILENERKDRDGIRVSDGICPTCCLSEYGVDPKELMEEG